jgi:proteasome lid subunit RPN8/RPN11
LDPVAWRSQRGSHEVVKPALKATAQALQEMIRHCEQEKAKTGNEACGYLVGRCGVATKAIPIENIHASPTSYQMNSAQQMAVQRQLREEGQGMEHLAIYHSHVATPAGPSLRDIHQATAVQDFFDGHYVVVSLQEPGRPLVRAFRIRDYHPQEEEIREV